jgi:lipoprotein-releasing system permease protein
MQDRLIRKLQILGFHLWMVKRMNASGRKLLSLVSVMSLVGMTLGVACLVVAMAITSGFENTLRQAVVDVFGHVLVVRQTDHPQSLEAVVAKMKTLAPSIVAVTPFFQFDGVLAHDKRISGVVVQGLELNSVEKVLNIRSRVIQGKFQFGAIEGHSIALIGKGIAKKFNLKIDDEFKVVLPSPSKQNATDFSPKVTTFRVGGVLDLGKNEYDERYIVTDLRSAQVFAGVGDNFSGIRLRLKDENEATKVSQVLSQGLGSMYWTMSWKDVNRNLFEAVSLERIAIFLVLLMMVIAASFNISSNLYVSVLQKYREISILKAIGFTSSDIQKLFSYHGMLLGVLGTVFGIILGLILCLIFTVVQKYFVILPGDVYRIDHIGVEIRPLDMFAIIFSTMAVCLISSLAPAYRGARLEPVEGLRYE